MLLVSHTTDTQTHTYTVKHTRILDTTAGSDYSEVVDELEYSETIDKSAWRAKRSIILCTDLVSRNSI